MNFLYSVPKSNIKFFSISLSLFKLTKTHTKNPRMHIFIYSSFFNLPPEPAVKKACVCILSRVEENT